MKAAGTRGKRNIQPMVIGPFWGVTAAALLVVSLFWAGSGIRHTGDTWIGLAAGRLICERLGEGGVLGWQSRFPVKDEFTFTFAGEVWTNQNWLVHVVYWLLYDNWSPIGLVVLKLVLVAVTSLATWRSAVLLSGSHPVSLLAACAGLLVSREFVDIRPNHVMIVYAAVMFWLLLHVKYGREWTVWLVPPFMMLWGNSHGSFLLGYVMTGAFVACEGLQRIIGREARLTPWKRLGWLCAAAAVSVLLVLLTSPYGWSNFTHPLVIMSGQDAEVFQNVMEWQPPLRQWKMVPQVHGFWLLVCLSAVVWVSAGVSSLLPVSGAAQRKRGPEPAAFDLTELALVGMGLYLALGSRRFCPIFIVLSLPVTAKLLAGTLRRTFSSDPSAAGSRRHWPRRRAAMVGTAVVNILALIYFAGYGGRRLLSVYYAETDEPYQNWLFKTHTHADAELAETVDFANRYGVAGPVFNEWTYGGYLMLNAPQMKLYIDGRSQALFTADFYKSYWWRMRDPRPPRRPAEQRGAELDRQWAKTGLDLVLVKRNEVEVARVISPLLATHNWQPLFETDHVILLVRGTSTRPAIMNLMRKYWTGQLQWPDTTFGWRIVGHIWQNGPRPDYERALHAYQRAIELGPEAWLYDAVLPSWRATGRLQEALSYYRQERRRIMSLSLQKNVHPLVVEGCLQTLDRIIADLERAGE